MIDRAIKIADRVLWGVERSSRSLRTRLAAYEASRDPELMAWAEGVRKRYPEEVEG